MHLRTLLDIIHHTSHTVGYNFSLSCICRSSKNIIAVKSERSVLDTISEHLDRGTGVITVVTCTNKQKLVPTVYVWVKGFRKGSCTKEIIATHFSFEIGNWLIIQTRPLSSGYMNGHNVKFWADIWPSDPVNVTVINWSIPPNSCWTLHSQNCHHHPFQVVWVCLHAFWFEECRSNFPAVHGPSSAGVFSVHWWCSRQLRDRVCWFYHRFDVLPLNNSSISMDRGGYYSLCW